MEEITRKVVSYCEIPQELTEKHWIQDSPCDVYVPYSLHLGSPAHPRIFEGMDKWIAETYPELINTTFLIYMDY